MHEVHGVDVNATVQQRAERHVYANFIRGEKIALRKSVRIANVQGVDSQSGSGQ